MERVRKSVIAGTWYPGNPETLKREIGRYLNKASVEPITGVLKGLVVPHAGYIYSGWVAAYAYKLLEKTPRHRVIIVAPSHHAYFHGASVYTSGGYETPLGIVPLDREIIDGLLKASPIVKDLPEAHLKEHSLEIQLPFLQVILENNIRLTPIVMGVQTYETCEALAKAIVKVIRDKDDVILIASSDLSHYHSEKEANELDRRVIEKILAFDPAGLMDEIKKGRCEACGAGPIATVMLACKELGATRASVLKYATSADVTGDRSAVVGYLAAAFVDNPGHGKKVGVDLGLSDEEKRILKELAYATIKAKLEGKPLPSIPNPKGKLLERRGAFVTIHKNNQLRGCIGYVEGHRPLWETVRDMAIHAAFHDPRFPALSPQEFPFIDIEISVLTPLERLKDISDIEIGKHGLVVRKGFYSGLLLPQVAAEYGWDRETFLEWTCRKAGLPPDAWKSNDVEIYIFSADVF
ncbi:MAG: AmmeMemoRadiSam system protein B [Thermodesulforhabdaceae bacterium]